MTTNTITNGASFYLNHIPTYARFQWLNHKIVRQVVSQFLKPARTGRKGYDKVTMFQWLMYKQVMGCSYRDLESITRIDYSTFIKFRRRLILTQWFSSVFRRLVNQLIPTLKSITAILDSSFVETYSGHNEQGSEYNGYKEKTGYKLHQIIDYKTNLPLLQESTPGARSDIVLGKNLIRGSPIDWQTKIKGLLADMAYDGDDFIFKAKQKWQNAKIGISVRRTHAEAIGLSSAAITRNRKGKESTRCLRRNFLNKRTAIERYFSRKKRVFRLGEEKTRHLENFRANCYLTSIMEILEWMSDVWAFFTRLKNSHFQAVFVDSFN